MVENPPQTRSGRVCALLAGTALLVGTGMAMLPGEAYPHAGNVDPSVIHA
jgi:hypothetical protein